MKSKISLLTLSLLMAGGMGAQTIYDASNFSSKDLNGTARFVGMGGAMGALGGDISTMGTNPAGIGIYRSNDAMVSFGYSTTATESNYMGTSLETEKNRWSFDNIGVVLSTKFGNATSLKYVNFGFNYHKLKTFNRTTRMEGQLNQTPDGAVVSQTFQMANQAAGMLNNGYDIANMDWDRYNIFDHNQTGWLAALGWECFLYDPTDDGVGIPWSQRPYARFYSKETGGIDQYDFNMAFNVNDRFYFGVTLGIYDLNYRKTVSYDEDFGGGEGYTLDSQTNFDGTGFDVKVGAIVRPFEESPLRVGLALHTPTFWNMTLSTRARVLADIYFADTDQVEAADLDSFDELGGNFMSYDYRMRSPWTCNVSLGYTVGSTLALGAEYEYQDYSSIRFHYPEGDEMYFENSTVKEMLKGVHTFRAGAEYKVIPEFALRAGYNYSTTAYEDGAYKALPSNSVMTDTDFTNSQSRSNYTLGIGYRGSSFYADLAYQYTTYKSDFYAFDDEFLQKTRQTNSRSKVLLTLGMRF